MLWNIKVILITILRPQLYDLMVIRCSQSLLHHLHEVPPFEFLSPCSPVAISYKAVISHVEEYDYHHNSCQNLQNSPDRARTFTITIVGILHSEVYQAKVCLCTLHLVGSDPGLVEFNLFFKSFHLLLALLQLFRAASSHVRSTK